MNPKGTLIFLRGIYHKFVGIDIPLPAIGFIDIARKLVSKQKFGFSVVVSPGAGIFLG
jgi:hypothetical protein